MAPDAVRSTRRTTLLLTALGAYLLLARVATVHRTMWLLADQIRDWTIALGPFRDLPLVGTPSTAGGVSLGPIYYWLLWLSRVLIGPFVNDLPHAGAYGIALVQTAADLLLFYGVSTRTRSQWAALAVVLFTATAPHDLAVSAMVWNPAVSIAFVKAAVALRLLAGPDASLWWTAGTTMAAWFSVQAHSSAIFVAIPIVGSFALDDALRGRIGRALQQIRASIEVIVLLQAPFVMYLMSSPSAAAPTRAMGNAADSVSAGLRLGPSLDALLRFVSSILLAPWKGAVWPVLLALSIAAVALRYRRDVAMLAVSVAPLALAVIGFSLWRGNYDEYWYLPLAPCGALAVVFALTTWRAAWTAPAMAVLLIAAQPVRIATSRIFYPMPQYGALVEGSRRIVRHAGAVRRLGTTMTLPGLSNPAFPYVAMGGRFREDAPFDAVIDGNGDVQFRPAQK